METERRCVLALTTWPASADAGQVAHTLVADRLAACVSVRSAVRSTYRWEGAIEQAEEQQVLIKTTPDRLEALEARVRELHPYDEPEWLIVPVIGGSDGYLDWVATATRAVK